MCVCVCLYVYVHAKGHMLQCSPSTHLTRIPADVPCVFAVTVAAQGLVHLAPLPGGGIGAADVDVPAAVTQLEQQQQELKLDFLGPLLPPEVAQGIAEGEPVGVAFTQYKARAHMFVCVCVRACWQSERHATLLTNMSATDVERRISMEWPCQHTNLL